MRVICVSRHGFSVLVYHHVSAVVFSEADNEYGITYPVTSGGSTTSQVAVISNTNYMVQIMGLSPEDATNAQ